MPQRAYAFLLAGPEEVFRTWMHEFDEYLRSINIQTTLHMDTSALAAYWYMLQFAHTCSDPDLPILIAYCGHGNEHGWITDNVSVLPHERIATFVAGIPNQALIVSDSCYAERLLVHIAQLCDLAHTGFIAPFGSERETSAAAIDDCLASWRERRTLEDRYSRMIFSGDDGDHEGPPQIRWGAKLDRYFWPTP